MELRTDPLGDELLVPAETQPMTNEMQAWLDAIEDSAPIPDDMYTVGLDLSEEELLCLFPPED